MQKSEIITVRSKRKNVSVSIDSILYVLMKRNNAEIHVSSGDVYVTRMTLSELEEKLGEGFAEVRRGCLVYAMAVYDVTDRINLSNGESLNYTARKKKSIIAALHEKQRNIISSFYRDDVPKTKEEYRSHYISFENMPFAFTDIEMIFNEEKRAVDWVFRYGNEALARLEKVPLERLIGSSFGSLFSNMDSKWLRCYERAALYGETMEITDYSPEIDTNLKIICFPTFRGHCGCILFDVNDVNSAG